MPTEIFVPHPLMYWDSTTPLPRIEAVASDVASKGSLFEFLLQDDVVALPTADFSILPVLLTWLGEDLLCDVLVSGALRFIRFHGSIGYSGSEGTIERFEIWPEAPNPDNRSRLTKPDEWHFFDMAPIVSSDQAIDLYLTHVWPTDSGPLPPKSKANIQRLVERQTSDVEVKDFRERVSDVTYRDVEKTRALRKLVLEDAGKTDLHNLGGLNKDQLRFYRHLDRVVRDPDSEADELDLLLWLGATNYDIELAREAGSDHVVVDDALRQVLVRRTRTAGSGNDEARQYAKLLELTGVPSLRSASVLGYAELRELWRLRESESGRSFRGWFHKAIDAGMDTDIRSAYIGVLGKKKWIDILPMRALRILAPTAVGFLSPLVGVAATAAEVALSRLAKPWNPSVFLDDLGKVTVSKKGSPVRSCE